MSKLWLMEQFPVIKTGFPLKARRYTPIDIVEQLFNFFKITWGTKYTIIFLPITWYLALKSLYATKWQPPNSYGGNNFSLWKISENYLPDFLLYQFNARFLFNNSFHINQSNTEFLKAFKTLSVQHGKGLYAWWVYIIRLCSATSINRLLLSKA